MGFHLIPGVDISDADALVTDVKADKTFYSVTAPRKTGTYVPTVVRVINFEQATIGVKNEWVTKGSYTIPATAKKVIGVNIMTHGGSSMEPYQVRGIYNGVQKYYRTKEINWGKLLMDEDSFDGLGFDALLELQYQATSTLAACGGVAYYIT